MRARAAVTPIALLVLAAGAAAYAYVIDRSRVSDADRASRKREVFPSFRVDEVTRIELTHGGEVLVLERQGVGPSPWTITAPRHEQADAGVVDVLLRELDTATRERDVQPGDARGLDHPRVKGVLRLGALEYRFALGDDAPRPEGAAYMALDGEGTFVVSRALTVQLLRGADSYRERTLVPYGASVVARLEVAGPGGGFVLTRSGTTFRLGSDGLRASRAGVEHLFSALADTVAERFLEDAEADRSLETGARAVTIDPRDGAHPRVRLRVGGACPGGQPGVVIARLEPGRTSACVSSTIAEALGATPASLADPSPLYAHADEMEDLRLERVGGDALVVDLARKGTAWHERAPEDRDLSSEEADSANALALALASARGTEVRPGPADGFQARARATIVRTGGSVTEVVEIGAPQADGTTLLRRQDDGAILRLPADAARAFEPRRVAVRAPAVWRHALDSGAVVSIESTCGPSPERLDLRDGVWSMRSPAGFAVDPVAVSDLAGAVTKAKAEAWLAETDDGTFGFGGPSSCQVMLGVGGDDGAAERRDGIVFGAPTGDGFFAHTLQDPAVFVAAGVLRAIASHPAIDRRRFRLDLGSLASLVVVHGGQRRAVSTDPGEEDRLPAALAALYAQTTLHAGAATPAEGMAAPVLEIVATTRADAAAPGVVHLTLGAATQVDGADGYYARAAGVDATFFVPRHVVDSIVALLGG